LVQLRKLAVELGIAERVNFPGYIRSDALRSYLEAANVGVAYVPCTPYYDNQPPTKTFEYLLAGMPVIATATGEHRRIVTDANGILVKDSPEGFYDGLRRLVDGRRRYDSDAIRHTVAEYSWEDLICRYALPSVEGLVNELDGPRAGRPSMARASEGDRR
jgi:glycosyltransferase involved in cell wall biosynthesis